jgi:hypothetical protein
MRNILLFFLLISLLGFAEKPYKLIMGVRNTNFAFIGYQSHRNWNVRLENSMFVRQLSWQHARVYGEYTKQWDKMGLEASVEPYVGSNYSGQFYDTGLWLGLTKKLGNKTVLNASIIPAYDSGKGYRTYYESFLSYALLNEVALKLKFTNFPEYRNPEKRICIGLVFDSGNLQINPEITIPTEGDVRTSRINISFQYELRLHR